MSKSLSKFFGLEKTENYSDEDYQFMDKELNEIMALNTELESTAYEMMKEEAKNV